MSSVWLSARPTAPSGKTVAIASTGRFAASTGLPSSPTTRLPLLHAVEKSSLPGAGPSDRAGMASAAPRPAEGGQQHPDQELATGEPRLLIEGGRDLGRGFRRGRRVTHLDHIGRDHEVLCPEDDADPERAERHGKQHAFDLRLATEDIDDEERDAGHGGDPEQPGDEPFGPGATHRCPRRPTQRATRRRPTPYAIQATYPSATGPVPPTGCPPGDA